MNEPLHPVAVYRRYWLPDLLVLGAAAGGGTTLFWLTNLDVVAARWFFHAGTSDPWSGARQPLWWFLYQFTPWVTGVFALFGAGMLLAGLLRKERAALRRQGLFLLLAVSLGPGIIVNGIFKNHWGRPRPRQLIEFSGTYAYVPPLMPVATHGKSFPCGHCSVGFLYSAGWFVWRRRRPGLAAASLAFGLGLGTLLGFGRMAAGGHFLSDVLWAAVVALGVAHALYYFVLKIPAREDAVAQLGTRWATSPRRRAMTIGAAASAGLAVILGGVLATPSDRDLAVRFARGDFPAPPEVIELSFATSDVSLTLTDAPEPLLAVAGHLHGFGLPTNSITETWSVAPALPRTLLYRVGQRGWFTDLDGNVTIRVSTRGLRRIALQVGTGNITIHDTRGGAVATQTGPVLDIRSAKGSVTRP